MTARARRAILLAGILAAAVTIGIAIQPWAFSVRQGTLARLHVLSPGWALILAGIISWWRRPENRAGAVMVAAGFAWFLPIMIGSRNAFIWTLGSTLETAFFPFLFYLVLSFPDGRLAGRWSRFVFGFEVARLAWSLTGAPFYDPVTFGCTDCPRGLNLLLVRDDPGLVETLNGWNGRIGIVTLALLIATVITRYVRATTPRRRVIGPLVIPAVVWGLAFVAYYIFQQLADQRIYEPPTVVYTVMIDAILWSKIGIAITVLIGFARYRSRRARLGQLVVELGEMPPPERLQDALRRTLGDPSLVVGYRAGDMYVTADGAALDVPSDGGARAATFLQRDGRPVAVLVHDRALLDEREMIDAAAAAARLAVENERLQAEVRAQLEEVRASRARIVEAADEERRRVERDLHDGAQGRLVALALALRLAASKLEDRDEAARAAIQRANEEVSQALSELRELARGIHPSILTDEGLAAALEALAERASVRVDLEAVADERLSARIEAGAYFVVSEAITNAAKHAAGARVRVRAVRENGMLHVEIADDGPGGADVARGSGLRGLADRVEALDGTFEVVSGAGAGTRIVARIPC